MPAFYDMLRCNLVIFAVLLCTFGAPQLKHNLGGRIVNGTDAPLGKYPFMLSLQKSNFGHFCGGSILNEIYILTAAHCVSNEDASKLSILVGTVDLRDGGERYNVEAITVHEDYNVTNNAINDIAVLKLQSAISFNEDVQPVKLPAQMEPTPDGTPATVIGFGYPYSDGDVMQHLQQVDIIVYSDEECQAIHNDAPHDSNICAGVPEGGKGQCSGDSGGPLIANGHQIGIVSWSEKPCTVAPYPGVYTELAYYIDWLAQHAFVQ
ncbi:chymotrypsin-2-like [Periplaneta americana]|uniref:chymotrypsin-2-like n=1 Tax=Periplaneta americana TaxID=6978 RepID=UPI0037E7AACA